MPMTLEELRYLWAVHRGENVERSRQETASKFDPNRSWVSDSGYNLSDRVWDSGERSRKQIDSILEDGIANGSSELDMANQLDRYLNPEFRPIRTIDGEIRLVDRLRDSRGNIIINRGRTRVLTNAPYGLSGTGSYYGRMLARTEISHAHGKVVNEASEIAGVVTQWNLSNRHPASDICDSHAAGSSARRDGPGRLPRGHYYPDELPTFPAHPSCLCGLTSEDPRSYEDVVAAIRRESGLEDLINEDRAAQGLESLQPWPLKEPAIWVTPASQTPRPSLAPGWLPTKPEYPNLNSRTKRIKRIARMKAKSSKKS
jgi:hypothetical protein